jgi:hypothetical protein
MNTLLTVWERCADIRGIATAIGEVFDDMRKSAPRPGLLTAEEEETAAELDKIRDRLLVLGARSSPALAERISDCLPHLDQQT